MAEFQIPKFLENQGVDETHQRMMEHLPADIDTSEGGHTWNITMPHAYEKSYFAEYLMVEAIKMIFPMFAGDYPDIMEYHAEMRGLERKSAEYAVGEIVVTGEAGASIPAGSVFSTIGINDQPSIDFATTQDARVGAEGTVTIPVQAVIAGVSGNVAADTIVLNASSIDSITSVTNTAPTSGGIEIESVEALQERVVESDKTVETSYGGTESDYRRWALEVNGTGQAVIVTPEDDTKPIQIILTNSEGQPASDELCTAVYNHIMRPDSPNERLAPVNDQIEVTRPSTIILVVEAILELTAGSTVDQAKEAFAAAMQAYILEAVESGEIKYSKVNGILSNISAVSDHKNLTLNGDTVNIAITDEQIPTITSENIVFTIGTV